jgi:Integrase core domain.
MDQGTENLDLTKDLLEKHRIRQTFISAYHPQANGLVERGHDAIVNALAKYDKTHWAQYLPLALWADRITCAIYRIFSIRIGLWKGMSLTGSTFYSVMVYD